MIKLIYFTTAGFHLTSVKFNTIETVYYISFALGILSILITIIPFIKNTHWIYRICEYPRLQQLSLSAIILCTFLFTFHPNNYYDWGLSGFLVLNIGYLLFIIFPFTPLAKKQVKNNLNYKKENSVKILVANVYQDNDDIERCKNVIAGSDPDIVMLVETDRKWQKGLESLLKEYPYHIFHPLENTYGLLFYSRLKLENQKLMYLTSKEIPSIRTEIFLKSGKKAMLFGLHPKPPVPSESEDSDQRDAEILLVGKMARQCNLPVLVCGDLNDVAWSHTTNLFLVTSHLLDPRKGRGLFNTFHARHFMFRWPLDHFFCSKHFTLKRMERLPRIGSDHFPIFIELCLEEERAHENMVETADKEEREEAEEKIDKGKR